MKLTKWEEQIKNKIDSYTLNEFDYEKDQLLKIRELLSDLVREETDKHKYFTFRRLNYLMYIYAINLRIEQEENKE